MRKLGTIGRNARAVLALTVVLFLSACHGCDYTVNSARLDADAPQSDTVMWLNFDRGELRDPYQMSVNRIDRGYAVDAPIASQHDASTSLRVSKSAEHSWFVGPRLAFSF